MCTPKWSRPLPASVAFHKTGCSTAPPADTNVSSRREWFRQLPLHSWVARRSIGRWPTLQQWMSRQTERRSSGVGGGSARRRVYRSSSTLPIWTDVASGLHCRSRMNTTPDLRQFAADPLGRIAISLVRASASRKLVTSGSGAAIRRRSSVRGAVANPARIESRWWPAKVHVAHWAPMPSETRGHGTSAYLVSKQVSRAVPKSIRAESGEQFSLTSDWSDVTSNRWWCRSFHRHSRSLPAA